MSRRATRALLQKWLGPKAWKIAKGSSVGLIELYTGRGRLSDSYELVCNGSEAHSSGPYVWTTEGQWFTMSLIELW